MIRSTLITTLVVLTLGAGAAQAAEPCPDGVRCGTVTVPLDRADPAAGTIDIAYALVPRTDTSRPALGTIVPNPGGPGRVHDRQRRPLPRRAGAAARPPRPAADRPARHRRGPARSAARAWPAATCSRLTTRAFWAAVRRDLTRAALYGSAAVADDIDAVRAALGIDKLDLWGDSYGTFLMPVYAARHPEHVRSIVLDGAFPIAFDPLGPRCAARRRGA